MKIEFRRNLPHIYLEDAIYDISFRLANTIPKNIFLKYNDLQNHLKVTKQKYDKLELYDEYMERYLDSYMDISWLKNPKILEIVKSSIEFYNNKLYKVIAYCIMPNHIHLIIDTFSFQPTPLGTILKSIKQFSATESNKILKRKGQFWHHESFDHIIRSKKELAERIEYIVYNPLKVRLVEDWKDWPGTYVDENYIDFD